MHTVCVAIALKVYIDFNRSGTMTFLSSVLGSTNCVYWLVLDTGNILQLNERALLVWHLCVWHMPLHIENSFCNS